MAGCGQEAIIEGVFNDFKDIHTLCGNMSGKNPCRVLLGAPD
jgi:hypothetical protein